MFVRNLSRGTVVAENARVARSFWARLRGLMLAPALPEGEGLIIERCRSIHTHFMRFAIDALFLDRECRVVAAVEAMPPWRIGRYYRDACFVLELPAGAIQASGTRAGDRLCLEGE